MKPRGYFSLVESRRIVKDVEREASHRAAGTPGAWTWAALMRRVFDLDVLACPRCGGRLRLIATVEDPAVVGKILARLGLLHPADAPGPAPPSADLRVSRPLPSVIRPSLGVGLCACGTLQDAS